MSATVIEAKVGATMTCPGCGETLHLDWADGWKNRNGFTCKPLPGRPYGVHTDHITTTLAEES